MVKFVQREKSSLACLFLSSEPAVLYQFSIMFLKSASISVLFDDSYKVSLRCPEIHLATPLLL